MNKQTTTTCVAFAAACFAGASAFAGAPVKTTKQVKAPLEESCITGNIGLDVTSNYIRQGVVLENQGLILQPYADLHFRIYQGSGPLTSIVADIGIWNSFHDRSRTPGVNGTRNWFEFDFTAGLTFNIDKLAVSPYFRVYESPASRFRNAYILGTRISYDDSDLLGVWALHPYARVELNLQGTTGNSRPPSINNGQYYEVGITPSHSYGDLTLSLPINAGFGSGGFYLGNRGFGFIGVGIDASYALNFVPACLGKWSLHSGVNYYRLGGRNNAVITAAGAAGNALAYGLPGNRLADKNQVVFSGGLKVAF